MIVQGINNIEDIRLLYVRRQELEQVIIKGTGVDGDPSIVEKINIRQHALEPYKSLVVTVRYNNRNHFFKPGDLIYLDALVYDPDEDQPIFRTVGKYVVGEVISVMNQRDQHELVCRDFMTYLISEKHDIQILSNETPTQFIFRTSLEFGIPIKLINGTLDTKMSARLLENTSLYQAWLIALTIHMNATNTTFRMRMEPDGVVIETISTKSKGWVLESNDPNGNMINATGKVSIFSDRFANKAKSVSTQSQLDNIAGEISSIAGTKNDLATREDSESIGLYGIWEKDVNIGSMTEEDAVLALDAAFRPKPIEDITITTIGFFGINPFDIIYVGSPHLAVASQYFVNLVDLTIDGATASQQLQVSKIQDIPHATVQALFDQGDSSGLEFASIAGLPSTQNVTDDQSIN